MHKTAAVKRRKQAGMRLLCGALCAAGLAGSPHPALAQNNAKDLAKNTAPAASTAGQTYSGEQLDALLAPVALFPDQLLTQVLIAATYGGQIKAANDWAQAHKELGGDALDKALAGQNWDPSVKSLVPFPQVLAMLAAHADWTAQLGYAMDAQQNDVMASVQRLRAQAQAAGHLQSSPQLAVSSQGNAIAIAPAQPDVVYVPSYNPSVVYGGWPYPSYQPVYFPPPPAYGLGGALLTGLAFGGGVAVNTSLWGWASPDWAHGTVNVNTGRYNSINAHQPPLQNGSWNGSRTAGTLAPPTGPVGQPAPRKGIPAITIGRPSVSVPASIVRPPAGIGPNHAAQTAPANAPAPAASHPGGPAMFSSLADDQAAAAFDARGAESAQSKAALGSGQSQDNGQSTSPKQSKDKAPNKNTGSSKDTAPSKDTPPGKSNGSLTSGEGQK